MRSLVIKQVCLGVVLDNTFKNGVKNKSDALFILMSVILIQVKKYCTVPKCIDMTLILRPQPSFNPQKSTL